MGIISDWDENPVALFLSKVVRCEDCEYPCRLKEQASQAACERHMRQLLDEGKVRIGIQWVNIIPIKRRDADEI